jgi:hypothetical protein
MYRRRCGFPHYPSSVLFSLFSLSTATTKKIFSECVPPGSEHIKFKIKGKFHPRTGHEDPEGKYSYSSTLSLTSAPDGVGGQRHDPAALPPGKTRYPLCRWLGGFQGRSGRVRKISPYRDSIAGQSSP